MGLKGGVRKGRDSQVPGPCLRILSRWQQLFIGCRDPRGFQTLISLVWGAAWAQACLQPFLQMTLMCLRMESRQL